LSGPLAADFNEFLVSRDELRTEPWNRIPYGAFTRHVRKQESAVKFLVWIGIAMVICWGVLWLGVKMAIGAVHLLLLLGVVLIGWGLLHSGGGGAKT
jgi:Flp pilus assembly protein TadB